jgi:amidase
MDMTGSALLPVNIATDGVVTRTVRDTVAFHNAVESADPPKKVAAIGVVGERPGRRLKIGLFTDAPLGLPVHDEVRAAVRAAGQTCADLGHRVEEIDCPVSGTVLDDFLLYFGYVVWSQLAFGRFLTHRGFDRSKVEPWSINFARHFTDQRWATFKAIHRLRRFGREYAQLFEEADVLVSPTVASPAPSLGYLTTDLPFTVVWERMREFAGFTPIQNITGAPSVSLPLGRSSEGLPIGVQFATAFGGDRIILELARELETAAPWKQTAPRRNGS